MLRRIALLVHIRPRPSEAGSDVQISDVNTLQDVHLGDGSFMLTLENESDETYARGHVRLLRDGTSYPLQSSAALFERLMSLIGQPRDPT